MKKRIDRKGFLLLLLYAPGASQAINEPIRGRTRLAKLLFLLKEEKWAADGLGQLAIDFYTFEPDNYGPFDTRILDDLEFFRSINFIELTSGAVIPSEEAEEYLEALRTWLLECETDSDEALALADELYHEQAVCLTSRGVSFVESKLLARLSSSRHLESISQLKSTYGTWPLSKLLRYIYVTYPSMAALSEIRDKIVGG